MRAAASLTLAAAVLLVARPDVPAAEQPGAPAQRPAALLDKELARAVRHESAAAVMYWWGASSEAVKRWRRVLGVGRADNEGTWRLVRAAAEKDGEAARERGLTDEECDERSRRALRLNLARHLWTGYHGPRWTPAQLRLLGRYPDEVVAAKVGRTAGAVQADLAGHPGRARPADVPGPAGRGGRERDMTPEEWGRCTDPQKMLRLLTGRAGQRKVRLLLCACGRALWGQVPDGRSHKAVEVSEHVADEPGAEDLLGPAYQEAAAALRETRADERATFASSRRTPMGAAEICAEICLEAVDRWVGVASAVAFAERAIPREALAQLLPEIFNPFRPLTVDPVWLAWHAGAIGKLAAAVYEERELPSGHLDAVRLAILADMLEEAGATDPRLLGHLRLPGPHVRGCWAVDAVVDRP
jgi:hypothetical protein